MKRLILAVLIILLIVLTPDTSIQAQTVGQSCLAYPTNFLDQWEIIRGNATGLDSIRTVYRTSDFLQSAVFAQNSPFDAAISEVWLNFSRVYNGTTQSTKPYLVIIKLFQDNVEVFNTTYSLDSATTTSDRRITIPATEADRIVIETNQFPESNELGAPFDVKASRLCGVNSFPTPTPTPTNTLPPPTATPGPTNTPYPTVTPRPTNTATRTRTPVPTWTPFPNTLPPSWTPAPTSTPGGDTDTPVPTYTVTPSPTAVIPTQEPMHSTLAEPSYSTPKPPNDECTDPTDPCEYFPPLIWPEIGLESPTPVALLPTLTGLPSITPAIAATNGTPGYEPVEVRRLATAITNIDYAQQTVQAGPALIDAEGTPVYVAQKVYEIGATVGGFWSIVRGIADSDLGPIGGFLIFLIAMIMLNVTFRLILFFVPIIIKIVQFVLGIIGAVLKVLLFLGAIAVVMLSFPTQVKAQDPTTTPIPVSTFTPTPTLYAIPPTSTSPYQGFRQTPTPIPYVQQFDPDSFGLNSEEGAGQLADVIINSYRFMNSSSGIMDMFSFALLVGVCVVLLINIHRRLTKDTG